MTAVIAYDKPVKNLIDQLSATGHVTHTAYKKTSVTLHHNGGRLSHEGVLNVWKTRRASAHFDVDSSGAVAQFVKVNEYAWAVGNTSGNQSSISIEMANSTMAPDWLVADATWNGAARLAGWLFFKVIGARPTKNNLFYHHHWASTECAGPYMDKIYDKVLKAAQAAYDSFKGTKTQPTSPAPTKSTGKKSLDEIADEVIAGEWGNNPERAKDLTAAGYNSGQVQDAVNAKLKKSAPSKHAAPSKPSIEAVARAVRAGKYGNGPARVRALIAAGFNPDKVQAEVNRQLDVQHGTGTKSIKTVAAEVWAGKWGNGDDRIKKLRASGYDPSAVQREVNRLAKK